MSNFPELEFVRIPSEKKIDGMDEWSVLFCFVLYQAAK